MRAPERACRRSPRQGERLPTAADSSAITSECTSLSSCSRTLRIKTQSVATSTQTRTAEVSFDGRLVHWTDVHGHRKCLRVLVMRIEVNVPHCCGPPRGQAICFVPSWCAACVLACVPISSRRGAMNERLVLIADSDVETRHLLEAAFGAQQFRTIAAFDDQHALTIARTER